VLDVLHCERFVDAAPATVYATLLDEGTYLCSTASMYRILREAGEVGDRRAQATHPATVKPELLATRANTVWSWDITKLRGPARRVFYHLYSVIDIYSRYTVGWMLADREDARLAERLLADSVAAQGVDRGQLSIHADRGPSMASRTVAELLADLGVTKSHSRPRCSNDNPFSEAQYKTLKYRPDFPDRFASIQDARAHCHTFFAWYNHDHRHSGIGYHTPADVHYGHALAVRAARADTLTAAYTRTPERFVRKHPEPPPLPTTAWINQPLPDPTTDHTRKP
jgi:putative transposase